MFTGLIQAIGTIKAITPLNEGKTVWIIPPSSWLNPTKASSGTPSETCLAIGDSVALNGCCTTVVALQNDAFQVILSKETLLRTTFDTLEPQATVNLELPLRPTDRLGGHYVTGHVDCIAHITAIDPIGISWRLGITLPPQANRFAPLLVEKGSVTIDGISLTVNTVKGLTFEVCIIPHTMAVTTLGQRQTGDAVHIETDLLGKYVQQLITPYQPATTNP
jgi:riboflavin synthase